MKTLIRFFLFATLISLIIVASARTSGLDYQVYLSEFIDPVNDLTSYEVGYVALIKFVAQISGFWLVLLICNSIFFGSHRVCLNQTRSIEQAFAFLVYLIFISLFLVYGSPRRLVAYSLISYIITVIVFQPKYVRKRALRHIILFAIACTFHMSALIFTPFLFAYTFGMDLSRGRALLTTIILTMFVGLLLYGAGAFEYLTYKLTYYAVDAAADPAGYLSEVPSVTSGALKRLAALSLLWFGTRHSPQMRRPVLDFCIIETVLYVLLGTISPVLAVAANYFSISYLLPVLLVQNRSGAITTTRLIFLFAAMIYYIPTSIGLINLLGDFYVS
jgi:hypothetical protein